MVGVDTVRVVGVDTVRVVDVDTVDFVVIVGLDFVVILDGDCCFWLFCAVLRVFKTPVYLSDTLQTLARRHYENEIYILSKYHKYLKKVYYKNFKEKDAHMRMPLEKEKTLEEKFKKYKEKFCK